MTSWFTWMGADYPAAWNGTVLLYSHGAVLPGSPNPALIAPDRFTGSALLERGYALAGSSYAGTGWAVEEALDDQIEALQDVLFDDAQADGRPLQRRTFELRSALLQIIRAGSEGRWS